MQPYFNKMTPTGYHEIETEIDALKQDRPAKIKQLQEARALGDLSENAEYSAAKRDLRHLESRLRFLNKQLQYAQVVQPSETNQIDIGKRVTLEFSDDHFEETYTIVGKQEADLKNRKLSFDSPLGRAILNHTKNDVVSVTAPDGQYHVKIVNVEI